ncbi:Fic/DOC family protein [Lachnospiraceae bacterium NE2001]|nr:Fic/DOC family protein [Lachnospiraceae bacterium NE2001]
MGNVSRGKQIKISYAPITCGQEVKDYIAKAKNVNSAISKLRPFEDTEMFKQVKSFYKTDCVWSSEALEGNTITKGETQVMLEEGVTVQGHPLKDILYTTGHAEAFDRIFDMMNNKAITVNDIINLHSIIVGKGSPEIAGKYKKTPNIITGSNYATIPPNRVLDEMDKFDNWLKDRYGKEEPVLLAAEAHRKLVYIHPFTDGNGRTARLTMNAILIQNGYLPISITPYIKMDYNSALELGRQGDLDSFYKFIFEQEFEAEKDFCRYMNIEICPKGSSGSEKL